MSFVPRIATTLAVILSAALPSHAETITGVGVVGVLHADGTFHPMVAQPKAGAQAAATTFTGTINMTISVTIVSSAAIISRTTPIRCVLNANVANNSGGDSVAEVSQYMATISGSQATCKLSIPYTWSLATPSTDYVLLGYGLSWFDSTGNGRNSYIQMPTIPVPSSGAIVTYTKAARL